VIAPGDRSGCSELDQWFTPFWAAEALTEDALRGLGRVSVCEPSCGSGAFLAAVPADYPAFGVEIDARAIPAAVANSGREVLLGDFRTIDLGDREVELVLGNPPFSAPIIDGFFARAHEILPDGGRVAMILPTYVFKSALRVVRLMDRFSIDVSLIPRTLFPRLSRELVWAKCIKGGERRFYGLMLFDEKYEVEQMRRAAQAALCGPGTWREAVRGALESLGGTGSLAAIYDRIAPERREGRAHWQPKVRQILQRYFQRVGSGRWAIPA
jgi:site-specific DNA-methyltransferase (adenine-specific)